MKNGDRYEIKKTSEITPDKNQPRKILDEDKLRDMAESMKTEGIINAIEIDEKNVIITGEMRWRAAKLAGLETVPCKIINSTGRDRLRRQLVENLHNNTMSPIDTAKAIHSLGEKYKDSFNRVSLLGKEIGCNKDFIHDHLVILSLTEPVQKLIGEGELPRTVGRVIRLIPSEHRERFQEKLTNDEFGDRTTAFAVARVISKNEDKANEILNIDFTDKDFREARLAIKEEIGEVKGLVQMLDEGERSIDSMEGTLIRANEWLGNTKKADIPPFFDKYITNAIKLTISNLQGWLTDKEPVALKPFSRKDSQLVIEGETKE